VDAEAGDMRILNAFGARGSGLTPLPPLYSRRVVLDRYYSLVHATVVVVGMCHGHRGPAQRKEGGARLELGRTGASLLPGSMTSLTF